MHCQCFSNLTVLDSPRNRAQRILIQQAWVGLRLGVRQALGRRCLWSSDLTESYRLQGRSPNRHL